MNWIPCPILPKKKWIAVKFKEKRAVTAEEHKQIVEREQNPERKAFYELCWQLGGSQSDIASLHAEDVTWNSRHINYRRKKTGESAQLRFGDEVAQILKSLPKFGPLFPYLIGVRPCDRATEFKQRCRALGIIGITLHSYRYSWAERAKACGYPERFAQLALGHNSKAVHRAYAKKARVTVPSLEDYEKSSKERPSVPLTIAPSAA
jgi:integrase